MQRSLSPLRITFVGLLSGQLLVGGCAHTSLQDRLAKGQVLPDTEVRDAMAKQPREATLLALEHGFNLLRGGLPEPERARRAAGFLELGHQTFEDLKAPDNFNQAFSADQDAPYRGRPHERVLTAVTLAVHDLVQGRCDMAVPTLRSAEFLDARWQPFPYGTDSPLVYALMLRCALQGSEQADIDRARTGLLLALRLKLALEPALELLRLAQASLPRGRSIPTRLAAILMEQALPTVLITSTDGTNAPDLISAAAAEAERFVTDLDERLAEEPLKSIVERVAKLAPRFADPDLLGRAAKNLVVPELAQLRGAMLALQKQASDPGEETRGLTPALEQAVALAQAIEQVVARPRLTLRFTGRGPGIGLEGRYNEIATVLPGNDSTTRAEVRQRSQPPGPPACGLHSEEGGGFTAVICTPSPGTAEPSGAVPPPASADLGPGTAPENVGGAELWSSTYQATSVVGRRFDKILEGRAQFKAGAENVSVVAGWTAWILFRIAGEFFAGCSDIGGGAEALTVCGAIALAILAAAILTSGVAGGAWLVGYMTNPTADNRFVHQLFESVWLLGLPREVEG